MNMFQIGALVLVLGRLVEAFCPQSAPLSISNGIALTLPRLCMHYFRDLLFHCLIECLERLFIGQPFIWKAIGSFYLYRFLDCGCDSFELALMEVWDCLLKIADHC